MRPGALKLDTHPEQDVLLDELKTFILDNGHAPRQTRSGVPAREVRLQAWISNNLYLDPAKKTPQLRARHEAIESWLATAPSYAEKALDDRLAAAEACVKAQGYRPSGRDMSWLIDYVQGNLPAGRPLRQGLTAQRPGLPGPH